MKDAIQKECVLFIKCIVYHDYQVFFANSQNGSLVPKCTVNMQLDSPQNNYFKYLLKSHLCL